MILNHATLLTGGFCIQFFRVYSLSLCDCLWLVKDTSKLKEIAFLFVLFSLALSSTRNLVDP